LHSHSYVLGAVSVEAPFRLVVAARSAGAPLAGLTVRVEYPSNPALRDQSFRTAPDGSVTIDSARLGQSARVRLIRRGYPDYVAPVATVGGGSLAWSVDYRDYFGISVAGLPPRLEPHREYPVTVTVQDLGDIDAPVRLELRYAGLSSPSGSSVLEGRGKAAHRARTFHFVATSLDANQAYVLRVHATAGSNSRVVNVIGTVGG
jgi:hypothetical protein